MSKVLNTLRPLYVSAGVRVVAIMPYRFMKLHIIGACICFPLAKNDVPFTRTYALIPACMPPVCFEH